MNKYNPRNPPGNIYALIDMLCNFAALLWTLFVDLCPLYLQVFRLGEIMDTEAVREKRGKFTPLCCAQVMWKVMEETRLFFAQRSGSDDLSMGGQGVFRFHI